MPTTPNKPPWRAALMLVCLTVVIGAAWVTNQAFAGTEGWQVPDGAETERNPVSIDPAVLARGQRLYRSKCQGCHGVHGKGDGPDADPKHVPADLTDARRASRNPDGVMFYKIWNGRANPKMPAMKGDLERIDVWTVVHYVKRLRRSDAPTSGRRAGGEVPINRTGCDGRGGGVDACPGLSVDRRRLKSESSLVAE
jgi:mono/diheme cytochrome c family protein